MNRVDVNQRKRVRRKALNFVNKRMKFSAEKQTTSNVASLSIHDVSDDCNGNTERNESTISNESIEAIDVRKEIASWIVHTGTPAMDVDSLLQILRKKIPKCCKTLVGTPKSANQNIIPMCSGQYLHIGLQRMLTTFLDKHKISSKIIILDVGIDGTPSTKSSDSELWPIMVNVVGCDEVLLVGSYFGPGKPKDHNESSDEFLTPFVTEILDILKAGGIMYKNDLYEIHLRAFVMDAPARAFIMGTILCTGYHSCTKCIVEGIRVANRTVFHGTNHQLRSNFTFRNRIHENHHHSNDVVMIERLPIDCVKNVPIDSMHNVFIGVQKQLLMLWINDRKKAYSIPVAKVKLLSDRIFYIAKQLPSEFSRKPRRLKLLKRFKATEFRQFNLYTLIVVLEDILPPKYYSHFLKFHCAIRILCTPVDCIKNNALASELLSDFVEEFGVLYGYHNLSHNIHSLLHLSADVLHINGPLDSYSAFKFENFLQYLKKLCRNNYRVLEQIHNRYFEKFSISDYQGDFKSRSKRNRTDSLGNYTDVHVNNMHLSVKAPNNYIINKNVVFKIEKIISENDGCFHVQGKKVKSLRSFYREPIPSNLLNIFKSDTNATSKEITTVSVTKDLHKVAMVELNKKYFYLALLH